MTDLLKRWIFRWLPDKKKLNYLLNKGTMLGLRTKNGRTAYLYMLHTWCVEVIFREDLPCNDAEKIFVFPNVRQFNQYLEKELRANY